MAENATSGGGWLSVVSVWVIALAGVGVVVGLAYTGGVDWFGALGPLAVFAALGVVLAVVVIATLAVQLATRRPEGFVGRVSASIAGAVVLVALASAVVAPVAVR
jgi:1,4-dihydroxy-2-naphthoate octaprenyltransferase